MPSFDCRDYGGDSNLFFCDTFSSFFNTECSEDTTECSGRYDVLTAD